MNDDDLIELAEMLEFINGWLHADDAHMRSSLRRHTFGLFTLDELTDTITRAVDLIHPNPAGGHH